MKNIMIALFLVIAATSVTFGQTPKPADPKDVASMDSILKAVYEVISGDMGKPRDWDRFRSLFYTDARLIPTNKNADTGIYGSRMLSAEDYVKRVEPVFAKQGFFENELARHVDIYGNITQVFSTYESRHAPGEKPFARGINSFQLLNDGKRWWVITIYWQAETPDNPVPKKFLKSHD